MFLAGCTSVYYGSDETPTSYDPVPLSEFCKGLFHSIVTHVLMSIVSYEGS